MSASYKELRSSARALALTLLFDAPAERDLISDVLLLGLELEKIRDIASEPMIAMIRLQWWRDLLETGALPEGAPPLASRLIQHSKLDKPSLIAAIEATQASLQMPPAAVSWDALLLSISRSLGWAYDEELLKQLGHNMTALYAGEGQAALTFLDDADIKKASPKSHGFFRLLHYLMTRQLTTSTDGDHWLVMRYLWCILR